MSTAIKAGLLVGILVELWTFIVIAAGWHKDPVMMMLFFVVIPIETTVIIMALKRTAADAPYGKQLLNGIVLSSVAGCIVFVGSYVLTTTVFPHYFDELRVAHADLLAKAGKSVEEIATEVKRTESMYDPIQNSMNGFIGTEVTGIIVSAIAAIFLRKK